MSVQLYIVEVSITAWMAGGFGIIHFQHAYIWLKIWGDNWSKQTSMRMLKHRRTHPVQQAIIHSNYVCQLCLSERTMHITVIFTFHLPYVPASIHVIHPTSLQLSIECRIWRNYISDTPVISQNYVGGAVTSWAVSYDQQLKIGST